jgi:hypothetical protein
MKKRRKFLVPLDGAGAAGLPTPRGNGIIVLGRRGVSQVRDFFIGRVTNKVVHLARDRSVCIVH